ncbi:MAG: Ig-like domain-containing protein, partial [Isosphaeraceae bacterium]
TASIGVVAPGAGTPTGTVAFKEGSTTLDTITLGASGTVSFTTTSALAMGSNSITAVYSGDPNFATSSSSTTETVNQAGTTANLSASPSSTKAGQPVTLTANIAVVAPGAGTPTGSVQFFAGTTSLGTAKLSGNTAILTTTTLPVGTDSLTAQYLGDPNFTGSMSSAVSVTISPTGIATKTTLTSSTNPSVFGQSVTLTATVAPSSGSGSPSGSVTFYAGSTPLGTATVSGKKASLKTTSVPVGSQAITAVYSGNTTYAPGTSAVFTQTVHQDSTTTKVTSSANPSVVGERLTLTATVSASSPGSGTATGTVTFSVGSTVLGTATLGGGTASLSVSPQLSVGNHTIKASYGGDTNFKTSVGTLTQTVKQDSTTTSIVSSANPSVHGQSLTFTATVIANVPGSGTPTGSLTFTNGSTTLGTVTLSGGMASLSTAKLATGKDTITATYKGSSSFTTSNARLKQTVSQDAASATVTSSLNPSVHGQSVTFTAIVSAAAPGSGTPTGTVTFKDGSTTLNTATLNASGKAMFKTSALLAGSHSITVVYRGDTNFKTSTSAVLKQSVQASSSSSAAQLVDLALGALPDDDAPTVGSTVHDLALEQVSDRDRRSHGSHWRLS